MWRTFNSYTMTIIFTIKSNCPEPFVELPLKVTLPEPFGSNSIFPLLLEDTLPVTLPVILPAKLVLFVIVVPVIEGWCKSTIPSTLPVTLPVKVPAIAPVPVIVGDVNVLFVNVCVDVN